MSELLSAPWLAAAAFLLAAVVIIFTLESGPDVGEFVRSQYDLRRSRRKAPEPAFMRAASESHKS